MRVPLGGRALSELSRETLRALSERHVAFVRARLTGPEARTLWRENVARATDVLLATPVRDLLDVDAADRALAAAYSRPAIVEGSHPVARSLGRLEVARLREEPAPLGKLVPEPARATLFALLERPGLVPATVLREVIAHPAVEEGLRDVLFDALREFSERVNPFFSEWGLVSLFKKLSPFGLGPMGRSFESVQKEFDKRLQPEIRRFLEGFSRRALGKLADFVIDNLDEPTFVAMRREVASWLLEQPISDLMPKEDEVTERLFAELVRDLTVATLSSEDARRRRRALLELMLTAHGAQTLGEALDTYGATYRPDTGDLADATWPGVQAALAHPAVWSFVESLIVDFYEQEARA